MCPFADSRLKEPRFQASSSQQPILSTSMCSITVTRVTHEKGGHGNWSLLSLCPEQDARPGPRPALQRSQGQGPACPQRSRDSAAWAPPGRTGSGHPGTPQAPSWRQWDTHSPSLVFFFLASVPPNLPRKDSSFFILGARGVGDRGGAEDISECTPPTAGRGVARRARPRLPRPCLLTPRSGCCS